MHFITGKQMPRRTFLRGLGATVALPFLDAMVPAREVRARAAAAATSDPTRLVCIEEVHGLAGCNNFGAGKHLFAPETPGRDFTPRIYEADATGARKGEPLTLDYQNVDTMPFGVPNCIIFRAANLAHEGGGI